MPHSGDIGTLKPGDVLNSTYEIKELVGAGGTGEVYAAVNLTRQNEVAIKVLKREFASHEQFLEMMRREATVLHEILDDAVVRYYDLQQTSQFGGLVFLVMGFIRGPSLAKLMESGPVSADKLVAVARRVAQGLTAAHAKGAYHRDISPDNILLKGGEATRATLIDFGIAKDVKSQGRTVVGGGFAGKFEYAAPEQMHGHADARSDIYALGMTLLAAYRGKHPKLGDTYDEILDAKGGDPDLGDVPEPYRALLARMLAPRPKDRFQTAAELQQALDALGGAAHPAEPAAATPAAPTRAEAREDIADFMNSGAPPSKPPPPPAKSASSGDKSGGGALGAMLAILLVAALAGAGWYFGLGPGKDMVFGPDLPTAAPYRFSVSAPARGAALASGNAPSAEIAALMDETLKRALAGRKLKSRFAPALGAPSDKWAPAVLALAEAAASLDEWSLDVFDDRASLEGLAADAATRTAAVTRAKKAAQDGGLQLDMAISLRVQPLALSDLRGFAAGMETCGALLLSGGDGRRLGPEDALTVKGSVDGEESRDRIAESLEAVLDGRDLKLDLEVLSPPLCEVSDALSRVATGGVELTFAYGAKPGVNETGEFREGENPVIDAVLPAGSTGYLYVVYVDFQGKVFHMMPHQARQNNRVEEIGETANGALKIRVAYPISEASRATLGFQVTPPFGKSMVVALLTDNPLFPFMRPREESIEGLLPDLQRALSTQRAKVLASTQRVMVTSP